VPLPTYAPPLQPRAVAPPLGDMAVGTMTLRNPGFLNVSGPPVTMNLRNASAKDALMALADLGGYGFVSIPDSQSCAIGVDKGDSSKKRFIDAGIPSDKSIQPSLVSLLFRNESYTNAVNSALRAAGWGGILEGRTIYAGRSVMCDSFTQKVSKVIRLNQVEAEAATLYLSTLGALGKRPTLSTTLTSSGIPLDQQLGAGSENQQTTSEDIEIQVFRSPMGPLMGLEVSFDGRLGLVTLVGSPNVVAMGEQYLRQFDLRKRQVALAITIIDLDLSNDSSMSSSFAYRSGSNFIVNDVGNLFANIGNTGQEPPFNVPNNDFVGFLRAAIVSQNAKILANPTLIIQEGEQLAKGRGGADLPNLDGFGSAVNVGSQVVTDFNVTTDSNGVTTCNPTREIAGLTMLAKVDKADDNGFVTFQVSPRISAPVGTQVVPGCGTINILNSRALVTSRVRVRDGQTLILTGVISDEDRVVITKWPILGDIPIIGSLFRSTGRNRSKRELVILVTPRLVNDEQGGVYGYGYKPSMGASRDLLPANDLPASY
jgi:type IV pilus assembly protein PilQ